jgi:hypothetical protein
MFASISHLAFDRDDNLFVLDQGNARVLVFDAKGNFLRQVGKQGGGPGEFQFPASLIITLDGRIAVYDMMRRGYSLFDANGTYLEHVALAEGYGSIRPNELHAHPRGGLIGRSMPAMGLNSQIPTDSIGSPVFHQMLGEDGTARTLFEFMMPPPLVRTQDAGGGRQARIVAFSRPTFGFEPSWDVLADGRLAVNNSVDYEILITDNAGRPASRLTRPFRERTVTRDDQDAAREQQRKRLKEGGGPGGVRVTTTGGGTAVFRGAGGGVSIGTPGGEMTDEQIEESVAGMQFAERIPAIQRVYVDPAGRLWVLRNPERVGAQEPIDLITPDGRYIGTLHGQEIPRAVSVSGLAAYIVRNELDIEQVVVRRLPGTWN